MPGPTYWSIQRARSYRLDGASGIGALDPVSSIASSYFGSKSDEAAAKAQVELARIKQEGKTKRTLGTARISSVSSSQWKRWTPVLVVGAVLIAGAFAFAMASRRKAPQVKP